MKIGFFLVVQKDVQHFLHAASLVTEAHTYMPGTMVYQLTDEASPLVPGAYATRVPGNQRPLLDQRLELYASCEGEWLLIDTDVSIRSDVRGVFADQSYDVALCDRNWPHIPQGDAIMHAMPFNTGVVFSRQRAFWVDVLARWRSYPEDVRDDWMSEQKAVYDIVRTGRYRVKILPGLAYNYPPGSEADAPTLASMVHYKGPRKNWLTTHAYRILGR